MMDNYEKCLCDTCIHGMACSREEDMYVSCAFYEDKSAYFKMPPCKIDDFVWAIKKHGGTLYAKQGKVGEMFYTQTMKLMIVVSYISRGYWGKDIFATYEEAMEEISRREGKQ